MDFYEKLRKIQQVAGCPNCKGPLSLISDVMLRDLTLEGHAHCPQCDAVVGSVSLGKIDFLNHPRFGNWGDALTRFTGCMVLDSVLLEKNIDTDAFWTLSDRGDVFGEEPKTGCRVTTEAISATLSLLKHPWSGIAEFYIDGEYIGEVDLYEPNGSMVCRVPIYLGFKEKPSTVEIRVSPRRNKDSKGSQIFLRRLDLLNVSEDESEIFSLPVMNQGNPYPEQFQKILDSLPDDALILDCGCGDRSHNDQRVINFEYSPFLAPDIYGDGHKLPFRSNTFDFVLSQAVVEHLSDPFEGGREIFRVSKVGGRVYCESAFMQPLHAVPFHFFNTTIWGIKKIFEQFDCSVLRSEGSLHDTLSWIYNLTSLVEKGHGKMVGELLNMVADLDKHITQEELRMFSSFVVFDGIKKIANDVVKEFR